jgi:hypothetical protein
VSTACTEIQNKITIYFWPNLETPNTKISNSTKRINKGLGSFSGKLEKNKNQQKKSKNGEIRTQTKELSF